MVLLSASLIVLDIDNIILSSRKLINHHLGRQTRPHFDNDIELKDEIINNG